MSETISLREINTDNLRNVLNLSVTPEQAGNVAPNAVSIAEAYFHPEAWFRAIYAGEEPVGFVMLEDWSLVPEKFDDQPVVLWRYMIDTKHQRKGYGDVALREIVEHARGRTSLDYFLTSCVEGPHSPKAFYLKFGFVETGEVLDGEIALRYDLS